MKWNKILNGLNEMFKPFLVVRYILWNILTLFVKNDIINLIITT